MNKTTLYLSRETQLRLRDAASRTHRAQADIVREALERYLEAEEAPMPRSIGLGTDPDVTGASSEDWLRQNWRPR